MGQKGLNMKFSYIDILINDLPSIQNVQGKKQLTYSFNTWYVYEVKQCLYWIPVIMFDTFIFSRDLYIFKQTTQWLTNSLEDSTHVEGHRLLCT